MERAELIRALRDMKAETGSLVCLGCGYENSCSVKGCALIRAAANMLENEMAEYIEKQAVIGEILGQPPEAHYPAWYAEQVKAIPPADVRPVVRGRWAKKNDSPLDGEYCCSNCKQEIDIADGEETPLNRGMNYCPSCGADMRGGDSDG